jgi:hypothetical protein
MCFLGRLECLGRVFQCLPGMFVARQMIFFAVMCRGRAMRVRRHFVELGGSLVGIPCHKFPLKKVLSASRKIDVTQNTRTILLSSPGPAKCK